MKLKAFLEEHRSWIAQHIPGAGEYPYSDVKVGGMKVSAEQLETFEAGEDPEITIAGVRLSPATE